MTIKKINLIAPNDESAIRQYVITMSNNFKQDSFDPFSGTTAVAAGFGNVSSYTGFYHTNGPIIYFSICLNSASTLTWAAGNKLKLPFSMGTTSTSVQVQNGLTFEATAKGGGNATKDRFSFFDAKTLSAEVGHAGAGTNLNISGWYFRE